MSRALLLLVLASGLLLTASGARGAQPDVPPLSGRVVDLADVLSPATETALTARLRALEDSTTEQIAVLTVPSLNGENLETWATEVFRTWGLGQADQDNGVLVLIARDDRKIRIEVGYGLEALLTDASAGRIIRDEMTPRFRAGDFDGGTIGAVEAVIGTLGGTYVPPEASGGGGNKTFEYILMILIMGLLPAGGALSGLLSPPKERYIGMVLSAAMLAFSAGFVGDRFFGISAALAAAVGVVAFVALFVLLDVLFSRSPTIREARAHRVRKIAAFKKARSAGSKSVVVDGKTYSVPALSSSSSGGGGSSFSGGGGSSGGGGASGGW